ncbi:MAG: decaprenyl-phosphate phosphoribosyltransferase [Verrucomicrobia bacterium]|nr:decaprenyl-phosphate phosphoribosyltransferase [Verrucomicrobiota bacterium]
MTEKRPLIVHIIKAMRPSQWTKNAIVLAAFFFAFGAEERGLGLSLLWRAVYAMGLFCIVSSAVYIMNDLKDAERDRLHPTKRHRPIASGAISPAQASTLSVVLAGAGLAMAWYLSRPFFFVIGGYVVIQIFYTFILKQVALVDVFVIASGFVLRALAGAVVIDVPISPWLLLCALLLALFLGLCKRRHEKVVEKDFAGGTRPMLEDYHEKLLDQLIAIVSAATIVCYALYTLWPDTVEKFGTTQLGFTIPFVLFGIFRYLDLVYRHEKGGRPEKILLTDGPLLVDLFLYGLTVLLVLFVL